MFSRLLSLILILPFALPVSVLAEARRMQQAQAAGLSMFHRAVQKVSIHRASGALSAKELTTRALKNGAAAVSSPITKSAQGLSHFPQTFLLLVILGGMETVRQQEELKVLIERPQTRTELVKATADQLLNSFEFLTAFAGGVATNAVLPVHKLASLAKNSTTRPWLGQLLAGGITSLVTFVGWEGGKYLWKEAIMVADANTPGNEVEVFHTLSHAEIEVANKLRFTDIWAGRASRIENEVFQKVLHNAFQILAFSRPEMTKMWLYNTWRMGLATGEFIALLSAMVAAGTAGGAVAGSVAPVLGNILGAIAGFFIGFSAGIVGGVIVISIPKEYTQPVTDGIRRLRIQNGHGNLARNLQGFRTLMTSLHFAENTDSRLRLLQAFEKTLKDRRLYRDHILSALFEQIYSAQTALQEAEFLLGVIKTKRETEWLRFANTMATGTIATSTITMDSAEVKSMEAELTAKIAKNRDRLTYYFNEVLELQRTEVDTLAQFRSGLSANAQDMAPILENAMTDLTALHSMLRLTFAGLMPSQIEKLEIAVSSEDREKLAENANTILNLAYLRSFEEAYYLSE